MEDQEYRTNFEVRFIVAQQGKFLWIMICTGLGPKT